MRTLNEQWVDGSFEISMDRIQTGPAVETGIVDHRIYVAKGYLEDNRVLGGRVAEFLQFAEDDGIKAEAILYQPPFSGHSAYRDDLEIELFRDIVEGTDTGEAATHFMAHSDGMTHVAPIASERLTARQRVDSITGVAINGLEPRELLNPFDAAGLACAGVLEALRDIKLARASGAEAKAVLKQFAKNGVEHFLGNLPGAIAKGRETLAADIFGDIISLDQRLTLLHKAARLTLIMCEQDGICPTRRATERLVNGGLPESSIIPIPTTHNGLLLDNRYDAFIYQQTKFKGFSKPGPDYDGRDPEPVEAEFALAG